MSGAMWKTLLRQLRGLVGPPDGGLTDAQLLGRWLASRDEAAFELLVWRHGPTVLGVCQRLLRRAQDIEDAFQATFLVFLRKAGTIGKREAVGSWLYKVAYRVALHAREQLARLELLDGREASIPAPRSADAVAWRDIRLVLDEEVNRLPLRYRTVFVLCYLQGKTHEEAARELGVAVGTVHSRLARARERLRARLTRRGVTLTDSALAVGWAGEMSMSMPVSLVGSTLKAALSGATESAAAAGVVSGQAAALAKGVLHAMWLTKVKATAALVLTVVLLGGGSALTYRTLAAGPGKGSSRVSKAEPSARADNGADRPKVDSPVRDERIKVESVRGLLQKNADQAVTIAKYKEDNAVLARRVKELEVQLARTQDKHEAMVALYNNKVKELQDKLAHASKASAPSPAVTANAVEDAKDAVEIAQAQLQVKKAELQGVMIERQAAQRNLARLNKLAATGAAGAAAVSSAEEKSAKLDAAVKVKEAELNEQEIRIKHAMRRLQRLQAGAEGERPTKPTADQQIKEIRKDLELLLRKIDSLEKNRKRPTPDAPRP